MSYQVPQNIDPNKIFLVNFAELEGRWDPMYYSNRFHFANFIKFSSIAKLKGGKRIPLGRDYSPTPTRFLYLRVADMTDDGLVDFSKFKCIDEVVYKELQRYEIFNDDLVISIAGTIGKLAVVKGVPEHTHVILTENCAKIVINKRNILAEYLKLVLQLPILQKQIVLSYIQTTIPKLGLDKIMGLKLPPIPSLKEQKSIVEFYKKAFYEYKQKFLESKQKLASIDQYLLGELGITLPEDSHEKTFIVNYKDVDGGRLDPYSHKPYFSSAFENIKREYDLFSIKQISLLITSGITPLSGSDAYTNRKEGVAFVRSGDIDINGNIDFDNLLYIKHNIHNAIMKSSQVQKNDIMIAIVGATIGRIGIYYSNEPANINQAIALVRLKENFLPDYIKEVLQSSIGQLNLDKMKRPVARANINLDEIGQIIIPIPPINKQQEIADHISAIRAEAKRLEQEGEEILQSARLQVEHIILGEKDIEG